MAVTRNKKKHYILDELYRHRCNTDRKVVLGGGNPSKDALTCMQLHEKTDIPLRTIRLLCDSMLYEEVVEFDNAVTRYNDDVNNETAIILTKKGIQALSNKEYLNRMFWTHPSTANKLSALAVLLSLIALIIAIVK